MSRAFLASYRPLCGTAEGRAAIEKYKLPPFIDASIRREPDLQAKYPTISALCRGRNFAPRLREGDRVAYMTKQMQGEWRLVALLEVQERFESHEHAAAWHRAKKLPLPSNCMVEGNPPEPLAKSGGDRYGCNALHEWNAWYQNRADLFPVMLACKPLFIELHDPPHITREHWLAWHGGVPVTRTPPQIDERLWQRLVGLPQP